MTDQQPGTALVPIQQIERELSARTTTYGHLLPGHISPQRFQDVVLTALKRDPSLLEADRNSLFIACEEAANDGLLPDKKEGALVIYNTKVKVRVGNGHAVEDKWIKQCRWMPMIFGIRKKMFQGGVGEVVVELVHKNDFYQREAGDNGAIIHRPLDFGDRGPVIGGYAIIKTKDGGVFREVMSAEQIDSVEKVSKSESGPWKGPFRDEMRRKTILRRLAKQVPLSPEAERVVARDDAFYDFQDDARGGLIEHQTPRAQIPRSALFSDKRHVAPPPEEEREEPQEVQPAAAAKAAAPKAKAEPKGRGKKRADKPQGEAKSQAQPAKVENDDEGESEEARIAGEAAHRLGAAPSLVELGEEWNALEAAIASKILGVEFSNDTLEWLIGIRDGRRRALEQAAAEPDHDKAELYLVLSSREPPAVFTDPQAWGVAFFSRLQKIAKADHGAFWQANKANVLAGARVAPKEGQQIILAMQDAGFDVEPADVE